MVTDINKSIRIHSMSRFLLYLGFRSGETERYITAVTLWKTAEASEISAGHSDVLPL